MCISEMDEGELTAVELRERMAALRKAESKLMAMKSRTLAKYSDRCGEGMARRAACDELQVSKGQASCKPPSNCRRPRQPLRR